MLAGHHAGWGAQREGVTWLPPEGAEGAPVVLAPRRVKRGQEAAAQAETLRRGRGAPAPLPPVAFRPLTAKPMRVCCCCPCWLWAPGEEEQPQQQHADGWPYTGAVDEPYAVTVARAINSMSTASARKKLVLLLHDMSAV